MLENLQIKYQFPMPQKNYDKAFVQNFTKKNTNLMKVIKGWKDDQGKLKRDKIGMCPIAQLPYPYCYVAGMLCRLF